MKTITTALLALLALAAHADEAKTVADYKAEALAAVSGISATEAIELIENDNVAFIDVREADELEAKGRIDGAHHIPRGVLEFYIDPSSSMHHSAFSESDTVVFFCESGGRSMLAAKVAKDMGIANAVFIDGGFTAWAAAGGAISQSED